MYSYVPQIHIHDNHGIAGLPSPVSVGVPEALAEAMHLFQRPSKQGGAAAFQQQCVVVAHSEPTRLLMPWVALENTQVLTSLLPCAAAAQSMRGLTSCHPRPYQIINSKP